jgi:hypothetical protein
VVGPDGLRRAVIDKLDEAVRKIDGRITL